MRFRGHVLVLAAGWLGAQVVQVIPKTWEDRAIQSLELPVAGLGKPAVPVTSDYYYRIPERPVYRSYPIYPPGRTPAGYREWLEQQEPEMVFDAAKLTTAAGWTRAGELVFHAPVALEPATTEHETQDPGWWDKAAGPLAKDGSLAFLRYVVRKKGAVEVGSFSCAMCHTRVMADGSVIYGGQGNFPLTLARTADDPLRPVQVPDLIGVRDRRYLDHTGLRRQRGVGDLMRYAALHQGADVLATGKFPEPSSLTRYGDDQLYALALYVYSLKPPPNPNRPEAWSARGEKVFTREGCAACHTPPLYTNNKLTPVEGFRAPAGQQDVMPVVVGTDPGLALKTRRGTGYYKVPSLRGVWYRGPFEHSGRVATLEEWLDPKRLGTVKGHEFGLGLSGEDRRALVAFLKTL